MSRKSRRHGRHFSQSKRRKFRKGFYVQPKPSPVASQPLAATAQPSAAATQQYEPAPQPETAPLSARIPAPRMAVPSAQTANIAAELRRIGTIAGIILVILVALALVLH